MTSKIVCYKFFSFFFPYQNIISIIHVFETYNKFLRKKDVPYKLSFKHSFERFTMIMYLCKNKQKQTKIKIHNEFRCALRYFKMRFCSNGVASSSLNVCSFLTIVGIYKQLMIQNISKQNSRFGSNSL